MNAQTTCDTCMNSYLTQSSRRKRPDKSQQTSILSTFLEFFSSSEWQLHRTLNTFDLTMGFATNRSELINVMTQTDCKYPKMFRVNWKWNCCWLLRTLRLKRSPPHQIITFKRNYLNLKLILSTVLIGNGVGYFTHWSTAECWRTHTPADECVTKRLRNHAFYLVFFFFCFSLASPPSKYWNCQWLNMSNKCAS